MNQKFSDILGYTAEELRQRTFSDLTHPDDLPATQAAVRPVARRADTGLRAREALCSQ